MKAPRIILPLVVTGLALAATLATAALANAAGTPAKAAPEAGLQPADVKASFNLVLLSAPTPVPSTKADGATALQQAELAALFDIAPLSTSMRARLVQADAALLKAEREALFDVAPRASAAPRFPVKPGSK